MNGREAVRISHAGLILDGLAAGVVCGLLSLGIEFSFRPGSLEGSWLTLFLSFAVGGGVTGALVSGLWEGILGGGSVLPWPG